MDTSMESHWRRLGELLLVDGLIEEPDLEYALAIQRQKGGLLGEILVSLGFVSTSDIATALGSQHGVNVELAIRRRERRFRVPPPPAQRKGGTPWRPLGRLLVEKGLLSESGLERALVDQRATGRLLGQIVVNRGWVSAEDLTRAIAEQHGVELEGEIDAHLAEPTIETEAFELHSADGGLLHTSPTFLDATDLAFELIEGNDPEQMEIIRVTDDRRERVWSYSRERAEEEAAKASASASAPFGYDVTGWQVGRRAGERNGDEVDEVSSTED